ncbi:Mpo1-like protein [Pelomonas baiyunensis]|uniref:Mpo1-like protein n=1 Tax=Pelomonas baiyunensis TaxID=3299026 RepID=A0ABW7H228_9BURK
MNEFFQTLKTQRWDDHRYYHHSRINQSLHFISAISFLVSYALVFVNPAWAALLAWCVSMTTRQAGHFFFEPRGYDEVNQATDEHKEAIKVGYNIRRKIVLLAVWVALPAVLWVAPSLGGWIEPAVGLKGYLEDVGMAWFCLGVAGLLFRVGQLWVTQGAVQALAWMTKILTDPVHDIYLYHKAPLHLLRGELIDPMEHVGGSAH